ncbi:MAG: hypothetical protein ACK4J0_03655 [Candidatus Anstonellaceae archaeon]
MGTSLLEGQNLIPSAYDLGINLVIISIILAGFAIGLSQIIRSKKILSWGVEELVQAIINAALLGVLVSGSASLSVLASSLVDQAYLQNCSYPSLPTFISASLCKQDMATTLIYQTVNYLYSTSSSLASLASVKIRLNVIDATPLSSLEYAAGHFSSIAFNLLNTGLLLETQKEFLFFIAQSGFSLFLPLGLLLRMFFMTRKVGGAILAGAIGFYIFYPLLMLAFGIEQNHLNTINKNLLDSLTKISAIVAPFPQIDWEKENEIISLIFNLAKKDLAANVSNALIVSNQFLAIMQLYSYVFVALCMITTIIFIYQLASILGSEFKIDIFDKI